VGTAAVPARATTATGSATPAGQPSGNTDCGPPPRRTGPRPATPPAPYWRRRPGKGWTRRPGITLRHAVTTTAAASAAAAPVGQRPQFIVLAYPAVEIQSCLDVGMTKRGRWPRPARPAARCAAGSAPRRPGPARGTSAPRSPGPLSRPERYVIPSQVVIDITPLVLIRFSEVNARGIVTKLIKLLIR
jgi:hypothetical protein